MIWDSLLGMVSNDVAVDLGTANTLVYVRGRGLVLNEPTVVAVDRRTDEVIAVGREAKIMLGKTPDDVSVVRPLKDGVIADFEVTEKLLGHFIRKVQRQRLFRHFVRPLIIICVPSGITEVEKRAVRDSAENAGAREVLLVAEPIAAAVGVGLPIDEPCGNMVIDIGGGTTEIAVMALNGIVNDTSIRQGGDEMDEAILQYVKSTHNLLIGDQTAEQIKIQIGSAFDLGTDETLEVKGRDLIKGVPKTVRVSESEIRGALQATISAIVDALKQSLEQTPPELSADIVDKGIVMTGGGSLLRGLDVLLQEATNLPVFVAEDPLLCVVKGCGKILDNPKAYEKVLLRGPRS